VNVRNVKPEDVNVFIRLYATSYRGLEKYAYTNKRDIRRYFYWLLSRDPEGFFIVELNEPVGFIACDTNWFSRFEGEVLGEIHELFVHPKYRGRGIGRTLVNKAVEYAKSRGRRIAGLWVGVKNFHARKFYRKMGFVETISTGIWIRMIKKI